LEDELHGSHELPVEAFAFEDEQGLHEEPVEAFAFEDEQGLHELPVEAFAFEELQPPPSSSPDADAPATPIAMKAHVTPSTRSRRTTRPAGREPSREVLVRVVFIE
jgi:hypothetical protein